MTLNAIYNLDRFTHNVCSHVSGFMNDLAGTLDNNFMHANYSYCNKITLQRNTANKRVTSSMAVISLASNISTIQFKSNDQCGIEANKPGG